MDLRSNIRTMVRTLKCRVAVKAVAVTLVASGISWLAPSANAAEGPDNVTYHLSIPSQTGPNRSVLEIDFPNGISQQEAASLHNRLTGKRLTSRVIYNWQPKCGNAIKDFDSQGIMGLSYWCNTKPRRVQWDFQIATHLRPLIVSAVHEDGLWWWKNGVRQPKNAPHVVPRDYHFHGSMYKVGKTSRIQYQDHMVFMINYGGRVGRGTLTISGEFKLRG